MTVTGAWKRCFVLIYWRVWFGQLNALLLCRQRRHCAGTVRPRARGAVLETSSNWTIAKVYPERSLGLSVCIFYGKNPLKGSGSSEYSAIVELVCERRGSRRQIFVAVMWILLCISSSASSHSTSSTSSVAELSCLGTHSAVPSAQCNSEKKPLSNSAALRTLKVINEETTGFCIITT